MKYLYIANHTYPSDSASAIRIKNIVRALKQHNHSGLVISHAHETTKDSISFNVPINGAKDHLLNFIVGKRNLLQVLNDINLGDIDFVIVDNGYHRIAGTVISYMHQQNIPVLVVVNEWYEYNQIAFGILGPYFWDNRIGLIRTYLKADGIIAASSFLANYYQRHGINSYFLPPIVNSSFIFHNTKQSDKKVKVLYAGYPNKNKDYIYPIIDALASDETLKKAIELVFVGMNYDQLKKLKKLNNKKLEKIKGSIICLGKLPQSEIEVVLKSSKYTFLFRPNKKYSNAGFSTKVAESLSAGIPVLCNITSDMGKYIVNANTGFVVQDYSTEECIKMLKTAVSCDDDMYNQMQLNSCSIAKEAFSVNVCSNILEDLLRKCV